MMKEWVTPDRNPKDDGYWVAVCPMCLVRSPALPAAEDCDPWMLSHFASQHPDRALESIGFIPAPRWRRLARHAPHCGLRLDQPACTCGVEDNPPL